MTISQTVISREVRRFMSASRLSQADLAASLGVTQARISARLCGRTRWSLDDVDRLRDAGVPLELSTYDVMGVAQ